MRWSERDTRLAVLVLLAAAAVFAVAPALAQPHPFGGPRPPAPTPPESGLVGWLLAQQAAYFQQFSRLIRAAKADGSAIWTLMGVSFAYGMFHAAGPGHGKAVISSYLVANEETWRRGIVLSFASAFLQALVAVAVVGIAAALLRATARDMNNAVRVIEIAGYGLIALMGVRLTWLKGRALIAALRRPWADKHGDHAPPHEVHHHDPVPALAGAEALHVHDHREHESAAGYHHGVEDHCDHCGHSHGPLPQDLVGPGGWQRGLTAIIAVGLRPCSGALLVLVFALAQGLFWAGVVSTFVMGLGTAITVAAIATLTVAAKGVAGRFAARRSGGGVLVLRTIETCAAVLVLMFGLALLLGYMASERMFGV